MVFWFVYIVSYNFASAEKYMEFPLPEHYYKVAYRCSRYCSSQRNWIRKTSLSFLEVTIIFILYICKLQYPQNDHTYNLWQSKSCLKIRRSTRIWLKKTRSKRKWLLPWLKSVRNIFSTLEYLLKHLRNFNAIWQMITKHNFAYAWIRTFMWSCSVRLFISLCNMYIHKE